MDKKNTRDQYTAVLEQLSSKMDLMIEIHEAGREEFERFKKDTQSNFGSLADYLARIEAEIHGEVKSKVYIRQFAVLEKRVEQLEKVVKSKRFARV